MVLTRCRIRDITAPTAMVQFNLERYHGGPHNWVGGQMSGLNTAAHDPVFFLHHAFVDYIWELFRIRQARFCGVNPSTDYPPTMGLHAAERPMDGFPQYRNVDGYRSYWTQFWYRYERSPTCSMWQPFCGSPYLRCDMARQRCVSMARMGPFLLPFELRVLGVSFAAKLGLAPSISNGKKRCTGSYLVFKRDQFFVAPPFRPFRTQKLDLVWD
ncbi:tyrosinase-like protein [Ruditapes philippinarum]|uniref:tyrosinase-like protein n=1 Tax=Ruditapes philippinarum TaxID=129788 RepID=UPI00295C2D3C|nr:tyrosinase-like protein [Ruditapes philippinarum]